jgi:hypothetical protein
MADRKSPAASSLDDDAAFAIMDMCGRPPGSGARRIVRLSAARRRVLTCVRPLLRLVTCRGPVWESADRVHFNLARLRALVHDLALPTPSLDRCAILSV